MTPLVIERVVKWGECDPAGIIYTPRAIDYATEAVEVFYRDVVGIDWLAMKRDHDIGAPTVHASCDYLRPLAPNQAVRVSLVLETIGGASLTFRVECAGEDGQVYFRAKMVSCITDFAAGRAAPVPPRMRERALAYQEACRGL